MSEVNELEAIRARHEACNFTVTKTEWQERAAFDAHTDRATLLRLLDAAQSDLLTMAEQLASAREELREVREAARPFVFRCLDQGDWSDEDRWPDRELVQASYLIGDHRRLAAALKDKSHD
jgi:hypothetical protein